MSEALIAPAPVGDAAATANGVAASVAPTPEVSGGQGQAASGQGADNGNAADQGGQSSESGTATENAAGDKGGKPAGDAGKDALGAPEAYAEFVVPEGVQLEAELTTEISALAKELNLPQEKAQKLVDLAARRTAVATDAQAKVISDAQAGWETSAKADAEFGGDAFGENIAVARKALEAFGTPALTELLDGSKLQHHPEIIRLLFRVGSAISEDKVVVGGGSQDGTPKTAAKVLFPNMA